MQVSQKSLCALRAVVELVKHYGSAAVKIAQIPRVQAKRSWESLLRYRVAWLPSRHQKACPRRGGTGAPPRKTYVRLLSLTDDCESQRCYLRAQGRRVFKGMCKKIHDAISSVYDEMTFGDLVQREKKPVQSFVTG